MRRHAWRCAVAAGLALVSGNAALAQGQPERSLEARLDAAVTRPSLGQFWGAVLVVRDGKPVLAKGYGLASADRGDAIEPDTLFDIGSVTKQFTAAAALKLQAAGKLKLDEPLATYLPGLDGRALERAKKVTMRHLLSHTSGMSDEAAIQPINFPDRDKAVAIALGSKPKGQPGGAFDYCNAGYIVAAAVIERVSGVQYEQYVVDEVMRPAGMGSSGFINGVGIPTGVSTAARVVESPGGRGQAYMGKLVRDSREQLGWGLKGAGGIAASLDDMGAWADAVISGGLLDAGSRAEMFKPGEGNYGLGWFVTMSPVGTDKWSHTGGTRGFTTSFAVYPKERAAIAVLTNTRNNPSALEKAIEAELFGMGTPGPIEATLCLSGLKLNEYAAASWTTPTAIKVSRSGQGAGERVTVEVVPEGGQAAARVNMSVDSARVLAGEIRGVCGAEKPDDAAKAASFTVASYVYRDLWGGDKPPAQLPLGDGVKWRVMPAYHGQGPDGKSIVDARPTIILIDEGRGFWPLIMTINVREAKTLADELGAKQPE